MIYQYVNELVEQELYELYFVTIELRLLLKVSSKTFKNLETLIDLKYNQIFPHNYWRLDQTEKKAP